MNDFRRSSRIMFVVVLIFICNKFLLRPYILENDFPEFIDIFVLSLPNLCEAVIGGLLLSNLGLYVKYKFLTTNTRITEKHIYLVAVLLTAMYTLLQELKVHNLGGNNVCDPYDIFFSIMGLIIVYCILLHMKPVISSNEKIKL